MKTILSTFLLLFCNSILIAQDTAEPAVWLQTPSDSAVLQNKAVGGNQSLSWPEATAIPQQTLLNSYPSVALDSAAGYFTYTTDSLADAKQLTILMAFQSEAADSTLGLWSLCNTGKKHLFLTGNKTGNGKRRVRYNMPTGQGATVNTSVYALDKKALAVKGTDTLRIGFADSLGFQGKIAEFVILKNNTSKSKRQQWQTYLSLKYGASMYRDSYFDSQGDTLWHYRSNEAYSAGIAGIGRDDYFGLNQHQSQIQHDSVTIAINRIYAAQHEHNPVLQNRDFLLWGHNGETPAPDGLYYYYRDSIPFELNERRWKMRSRIVSDTVYNTIVQGTAASGQNPEQLCLLISPSNEFDSWLHNVTIYPPDSIDGNRVFYKNIVWDADGSGTDYFTFGTPAGADAISNFFAWQNGGTPTGAAAVFTQARWLPNPVADNLYINYRLTRDAAIWFSVHSNAGIALCQTPPSNKQAGYNQTIIPMGHLITGTYTVYVHVDDMVLLQTVVKK